MPPSSLTVWPVWGKKRVVAAYARAGSAWSVSARTRRKGLALASPFERRWIGLAQMRLDRLHQLRFRHVADQPLDRLAVLEHDERGDAHHAELLGDLRVLIDVDLRDLQLALLLAGDLLDDRRDHAARAAPGRPEIDEDRLLCGQHLVLERAVGHRKGRSRHGLVILQDVLGARAAVGAWPYRVGPLNGIIGTPLGAVDIIRLVRWPGRRAFGRGRAARWRWCRRAPVGPPARPPRAHRARGRGGRGGSGRARPRGRRGRAPGRSPRRTR